MSLGKFIAHIWDAIKHLFDGLPAEFKTAIHIGVTVVNNMKTALDNPVTDILTAIIPGTLDDVIVQKLREALPEILLNLKLAENCTGLTDISQIVECAIRNLQSIEGDFKSAFLHDLSILIAQVAADGKLSWSDGVYILQWYYDHSKSES
jgi:hypothetical protein